MQLRIPLFYLLLCLVLAGLIHIAAVLALPALAPKNAWARLVPLGEPNAMILLPAASPGNQVMPMMGPDIRYAMCRFDLKEGPVRIRAGVPNDLWLIALYTPDGDNFYTVQGADMRRAQIDLIVAKEDQEVAEAGVDAPEEAEDVVVVKSPVDEGIAMIRAPLSGGSRAASVEAALQASHCGRHVPAPQPVPPPEPAPDDAQ
jgi:uncharacterized membrane protein